MRPRPFASLRHSPTPRSPRRATCGSPSTARSPRTPLPRVGMAPVAVTLAGEIKTTDGQDPPQLRTISHGDQPQRQARLPRACRAATSTRSSRRPRPKRKAACRNSLVGNGTFKANVALPEQSPFPSNGEILAFNGNLHGKPVIYAHIYGTEPLPTSFVLPFAIKQGNGTYAHHPHRRAAPGGRRMGLRPGRLADPAAQLHLQGQAATATSRPAARRRRASRARPSPLPRRSFGFEDGRDSELDDDAELWGQR